MLAPLLQALLQTAGHQHQETWWCVVPSSSLPLIFMLLPCAGLDLQAQVQPLLPAHSYLCDVIQKGTAALLKVMPSSTETAGPARHSKARRLHAVSGLPFSAACSVHLPSCNLRPSWHCTGLGQ